MGQGVARGLRLAPNSLCPHSSGVGAAGPLRTPGKAMPPPVQCVTSSGSAPATGESGQHQQSHGRIRATEGGTGGTAQPGLGVAGSPEAPSPSQLRSARPVQTWRGSRDRGSLRSLAVTVLISGRTGHKDGETVTKSPTVTREKTALFFPFETRSSGKMTVCVTGSSLRRYLETVLKCSLLKEQYREIKTYFHQE